MSQLLSITGQSKPFHTSPLNPCEYSFRYNPVHELIKRTIAEGKIGNGMRTVYPHAYCNNNTPPQSYLYTSNGY
jgi:hypothetical protein